MDDQVRKITAVPFEPSVWAPFGWTPLSDSDPEDGKSRLHFEWDDVHVNLIGHSTDEVPHRDGTYACEMLFRHATHTQALFVINCRAVIAVAPAACGFETVNDLGELRAFLLEPHASLVLHRGTWHWGPFPVGDERVDLFNVQGLRYADDNDCVHLAALGSGVEISTS